MGIVVGSGYWKQKDDLVERVLSGTIKVVQKSANNPLYVYNNKNCFFCNNRVSGRMYHLVDQNDKKTTNNICTFNR